MLALMTVVVSFTTDARCLVLAFEPVSSCLASLNHSLYLRASCVYACCRLVKATMRNVQDRNNGTGDDGNKAPVTKDPTDSAERRSPSEAEVAEPLEKYSAFCYEAQRCISVFAGALYVPPS
jgi:hypothetical protein